MEIGICRISSKLRAGFSFPVSFWDLYLDGNFWLRLRALCFTGLLVLCYHCWQAMNQVDSHIPKLTIVQFKIKKRCPISALLWASCGDQDTRYINPVFQAWILHEAPQARECQLSWESPWWCCKVRGQVLSLWTLMWKKCGQQCPSVNRGMTSSLGKSLPLYLFSLNASFHKECVYNFLIAGRHLVIEAADWNPDSITY